MDFLAVCAFLVLYYIRPQDWVGGLGSFHPVMLVFIAGIIGMIFRSRGFSPKDLVKTPHDWFMLAFLVWIAIGTAASTYGFRNVPSMLVGTLKNIWGLKNYFGYYFVVSQSLYPRRRLEKFTWVWLGMILLVALLAVVSEFGIDPMGSHERTVVKMQGRLILNNGLFDNPNALGHGVIVIIPLVYLFCIWKRPPAVKQAALTVLAIPLYCVYLTKSKGSYLAGSFTALVAVVFGRPKFVKIFVIGLALTGGVFMMKMLPRMAELRDPRSEEGIQGRLMAFAFGYHSLRTNAILGKDNFVREFERHYTFRKASHSGYNQIGAEMGMVGFFLYVSLFYCALKTLAVSKSRNVSEERLRRVYMAAIAGFMASNWMIDLGYHGTFFFIMAAIAAYHRLMLEAPEPETALAGAVEEQETEVEPVEDAPQAIGETEMPDSGLNVGEEGDTAVAGDESVVEKPVKGMKWKRFGWLDLVWCVLLFVAAIRFWRYIVFSWGKGP